MKQRLLKMSAQALLSALLTLCGWASNANAQSAPPPASRYTATITTTIPNTMPVHATALTVIDSPNFSATFDYIPVCFAVCRFTGLSSQVSNWLFYVDGDLEHPLEVKHVTGVTVTFTGTVGLHQFEFAISPVDGQDKTLRGVLPIEIIPPPISIYPVTTCFVKQDCTVVLQLAQEWPPGVSFNFELTNAEFQSAGFSKDRKTLTITLKPFQNTGLVSVNLGLNASPYTRADLVLQLNVTVREGVMYLPLVISGVVVR